MTESEAKQKWCPILGLAGAAMNTTDGGRNCIGSACMMWRNQPITERVQDLYVGDGTDGGGYCGLAGKP